MAEGAPRRTFLQKSLPVLTKLLHGSAPFISTFLLIHLSAPMLANLGGSSLASQTMVPATIIPSVPLPLRSHLFSFLAVNITKQTLEKNISY
jgi:hypothetical protein